MYEKEVFKKIAEIGKAKEVELSSEVVELGLAQRVVKSYNDLRNSSVAVSDIRVDVGRLYSKLNDAIELQESELKRAKELKSNVDKAVKDLGLDAKMIDGYKEIKKEIEIGEQALKSNKKALSSLKNL